MPPGVVVAEAILVLRKWLAASKPGPGARLPSERVLSEQLGLKHNAVNRAMGLLIGEGLVTREGYRLFYAGRPARAVVSTTFDLILARRSILAKSYRKVAKELEVGLRVHSYETVDEVLGHLQALNVPTTECVLLDPPHGTPSSLWAPAMERLLANGVPAISIRQQAGKIPCVQSDFPLALDRVLTHLRATGHTDVALLTLAPRAPVSAEICDAWRSLAHAHGGRAMAKRLAFHDGDREDTQTLVNRFTTEWKTVTAVVVYAVHEAVATHLLEALDRLHRRVPEDVSLVWLGDLPWLATLVPPISAAAFDSGAMHEVAFRMGQRLVRQKSATGLLPPFPSLRMEPHLLVRRSIAPTASYVPPKKATPGSSPAFLQEAHAVESPGVLRQTLRERLKRPYGFIIATETARFTELDLKPYMNRSLHYRKGWMGDLPLPPLAEGRHLIHGVPFQILGGPARSNRGVVVFRSATNETGSARGLPSRLTVPVDAHADAIYFLHGCGYARYLARFASYGFYAGKKHLGTVPLVALGMPPHDCDAAQLERDAGKANIQDWWSDYPHVDFAGARQAPILSQEEDAGLQRHAYLYTLEWRNPFPDQKVTHIEIVADPEQSTTLGLIGISTVKKRAG